MEKPVSRLSSGQAPTPGAVPITPQRVRACLVSAQLWTHQLPRYANWQQSKADWWAVAAGLIASITGLAIFPVADDPSDDRAKFVVAFFALAAGICALVPRVKNYGEMAGRARELSSVYGPLVGRLLDALVAARAGTADQAELRAVLIDFESAKARKDQLRFLGREKKRLAAREKAEQQVNLLVPERAPFTPKAGVAATSEVTAKGSPIDVSSSGSGGHTFNFALVQFPARGHVSATTSPAARRPVVGGSAVDRGSEVDVRLVRQ